MVAVFYFGFYFANSALIKHTLYARGHEAALRSCTQQHVSKIVAVTENPIPMKESHAQKREGHCVHGLKLVSGERKRDTLKQREKAGSIETLMTKV